MRVAICLLFLSVIVVNAQRRLSLPDPRSCSNRVRHASYRDARGVSHSYFFSWEHLPTRSLEVDWLDARNICRRHCMDAVSLETPQENEFIKQRVARGNVRYIWTSGRKCNFNGCDRPDLQPQNVNGWFWSGSGAKIGPTSQRNSGDWSHTGGYGQPQPDNREAAQVLWSFPFSLYFPFDFVRLFLSIFPSSLIRFNLIETSNSSFLFLYDLCVLVRISRMLFLDSFFLSY
ncbi:PREDICTED: uncharacterized protein LOC106786866 isoform X1 [Polistes canadensis]|uniref:uncharacterized protein LOC106786866 isoform X1 n=1 Tax=Polistes canadensis TaxID=91411 RepID=UPI000718EDDF|nr:PREDICTED: uncharacterized protein LOC106786866 isoform X1 [Polistes canadensis]